MGRVRYKLGCPHWSPVMTTEEGLLFASFPDQYCPKCKKDVLVGEVRVLSDNAALPRPKADPRFRDAWRVAADSQRVPNHGKRIWRPQ